MSYTSRPPFAGGMSNQNQQQQQGGQQNNSNIGASGIPNMQMINNAASLPSNHLANPGSSSPMSVIDQKIFQQQLLLQRQLLMQGQQFQQQQPSQPNQQAKFQQQQPNQNQALNRIMSEMLNEKNGTNLAQQTQQLHIAQLQALSNMMQLQQAVQQKSFQQQSVPLPTNTTITPVARQNMQAMQKQPVNYPKSNVPNKNLTPNVSASPMQSRKSFPNSPKMALPQMQSGLVTTPLNISSASSKSTLPQMPSAMASAANSAKGYADILAASLSNAQSSMNITPSLTITKTHSPSSSYNKNTGGSSSSSLPNKSVSTSASSQKSFLSEAISMSLGNVPISVKASQPPSVTVTPTNRSTISPTNKQIPASPLKTNSPQNVPALQKLSPTSPRTKQTPRKNTNPVRTTSLSPARQTSLQSVVPHVDAKVTSPSVLVGVPPAKPIFSSPVAANVAPVKSSSVRVVPPTPPKANVPALAVAAAVNAVSQSKPVQLTPVSNTNSAETKPNAGITPKTGAIPAKPAKLSCITVEAKSVKPEEPKNYEVKIQKIENHAGKVAKVDKAEDVKTGKHDQSVKTAKLSPSPNSTTVVSPQCKPPESKIKQNAPQNAITPQINTHQSALKENDTKINADQIIKTPIKPAKASQSATPIPNSAEIKVKRNRFKTTPYQSPTPEIELVSKISAAEAINAQKKKAQKTKPEEDKLTLFYKNEFLAVRNADGGFYLCQAINNVYKSSPKIRIRWLSEETTTKNIYCLDFYDYTDIECVLTSVSMNKLAKGKLELTKKESDRIENILKKALDVEKGIVQRPDVTEENPDGLDLSLYKDESQIEKKSIGKRKSADNTKPAAKKQKIHTAKTPAKKATTIAKASQSMSESAKKSPVKMATESAKQNNDAKSSESADKDVQSTPSTKRVATKRKLIDEADDVQTKDDSKTNMEASIDGEREATVSKIDGESQKPISEMSNDSASQLGRATRRSRN